MSPYSESTCYILDQFDDIVLSSSLKGCKSLDSSYLFV